MELRPPPSVPKPPARDGVVRWLLVVNLVLFVALFVLFLQRVPGTTGTEGERAREVASKLKAAGAIDEASALYATYLADSDEPAETRAKVAFSLGESYLEQGRTESALRWYYEAETLGAGELADEVGQRIVRCLERLGRHQAAQAALASRVELPADADSTTSPDDPVVARIGPVEVRRSEVHASLDGVPPQMAEQMRAQPDQLLRQYVADELLWKKAQKLEYDRAPEVTRQLEAMHRQLAVSRFAEREVVSKIVVDETDLANFYAAQRERYRPPTQEGQEPGEPLPLEQIRAQVERDYRSVKAQSAFQELVDSELAAQDVELFPERMGDGG